MTSELWLHKPCEHGAMISHNAFRLPDGSVVDDPNGLCPGGSRVRLDPEQVVFPNWRNDGFRGINVQDIIAALDQEEE